MDHLLDEGHVADGVGGGRIDPDVDPRPALAGVSAEEEPCLIHGLRN